MSELAPPPVPANAAVGGQAPLSPPEIDALLNDFRAWLTENAQAAAESVPPAEPVDLAALVGQFVALRHEVNLQTKATRAQQQQNADTLQQLGRALEELAARGTEVAEAEQQGQDEQLKPLLKTLVD